jgi:hypothetical protein
MAVIAIGTVYVVNANAAVFPDTDIFVNDGSLDDSATSNPDIGNPRFGILGFLWLTFIKVCPHANYPVQTGACLNNGTDSDY